VRECKIHKTATFDRLVRSANVANQSHTTSMSCLRASISEAAAEKIVAKKAGSGTGAALHRAV
jgi:hypothetical protein